ncbi:MAG: hypothetical protein CMM53_13465 [Rhodospirillaceae bacterium]|nr:hypothetical protein [Rhodospirillaceae bacterium]|tara:strand:- start:11658 stop:12107 length:450 start_codon:yes stop_codon:yes gene_type:complete
MVKLSKSDIGRRFYGPSKTLTDAHFLMFSAITGDAHPIHYDVEYARNTKFGAPVAHGLLLSGLMALGASDARVELENMAMVEQGTQFLKPVKVGDTVHPVFEILDIYEDKNNRSFCRFETTLLNHVGEAMAKGFHVYQFVSRLEKGQNA